MNTHNKLFFILPFLVGFVSLVYEVYSIKVLFFFFSESTQSVSIVMACFLLGLGLAAFLIPYLKEKTKKTDFELIAILQVLTILYAFVVLRDFWLIADISSYIGFVFTGTLRAIFEFLLIGLFMFLPGFFMGGNLPLLLGHYQESFKTRHKDIGRVYFIDLSGAVLGALISGVVLLPYFGMMVTIYVCMIINALILILITKRVWSKVVSVAFVVICLFGVLLPSEISPKKISNTFYKLLRPEKYKEKEHFGDIIFEKPSPYGVVRVSNHGLGVKQNRTLFINYRDMCNSTVLSGRKIGVVASKLINSPGKALNIGLGCGYTAQPLAESKLVEELHIAEINPIVIEASKYFKDLNADILNNPKTILHNVDGAKFIRKTDQKFTAIVIDIEEPGIAHSTPLYTLEYFRYAKDHLTSDGVFSIWSVPGGTEYSRIIYNTLRSVYRYVGVDTTSGLQFYASDRPFKLNLDKISDPPNGKYKINTIENRALESVYDLNAIFNIPLHFQEK